MIREMILFCGGFQPDEDFKNFIESCHYTDIDLFSSMLQISTINFDERIINYVKENANFSPIFHKDAIVLKGKPTHLHLGTAVLLKVDTNKTWSIKYDNRDDHPFIQYQKVIISPYGQIKLTNEED